MQRKGKKLLILKENALPRETREARERQGPKLLQIFVWITKKQMKQIAEQVSQRLKINRKRK